MIRRDRGGQIQSLGQNRPRRLEQLAGVADAEMLEFLRWAVFLGHSLQHIDELTEARDPCRGCPRRLAGRKDGQLHVQFDHIAGRGWVGSAHAGDLVENDLGQHLRLETLKRSAHDGAADIVSAGDLA